MLTEKIPLLFLLPLRLACGYALFAAGFGKVAGGWLRQPVLGAPIDALVALVQHGHAHTPALLSPLVHHLQVHAQAYSTLAAGGELLAGAALLAGLFSRLGALLGLVVCLGVVLLGGDGLAGSPLLPLCAGLLTLSLCGAGRALGLDALLRGHVPPWLS